MTPSDAGFGWFCRSPTRELGARYVLFVMPRYQQYNRAEAPGDPEKREFPESDQYVLEPFRWFEKQARTVSFPIHSLLDAFRRSGVFPTSPPNESLVTTANPTGTVTLGTNTVTLNDSAVPLRGE